MSNRIEDNGEIIMKKEHIQILQKSCEVCDGVANAITKRNGGQHFCQNFCPGEESLIKTITQLAEIIKDIEPECSKRLTSDLQKVRNLPPEQCVNPYAFGSIVGIVSILRLKYLKEGTTTRKFFISHSSEDKVIVNGFVKEILKIGCGFKDSDIFCTLDPTVIRTGDDFRIKIVENLRECDFILLFISENYMNSEICQNEMGAAWALDNKRVLPFILPNTTFNDMGFLNEVKQGASITDKRKLDEFYNEVCGYYGISSDWPSFNKAKEDFVEFINQFPRGADIVKNA